MRDLWKKKTDRDGSTYWKYMGEIPSEYADMHCDAAARQGHEYTWTEVV